MQRMISRLLALMLCCVILLPVTAGIARAEQGADGEQIPPAQSDTASQEEQPVMARDLSSVFLVSGSQNIPNLFRLFDKELYLWEPSTGPSYLTLTSPEGLGSLYVMFTYYYGIYTLTNEDTGETATCGQDGFLHEFIDLVALFGKAPSSVTLRFDDTVSIRELSAFSEGQVPDDVQRWRKPVEGNADMVLFSTHADDEHLFFAGLLPYYAKELGYNVQVVYFTDHGNNEPNVRNLEALNGLWAVGVDIYPVAGDFEDFLQKYQKEPALQRYEKEFGRTFDEMVGFVVEQIRRFKPMVAVGHDFAGEYSHAMHMIYADALAEAVQISNDPDRYPESAGKYGLWDVQKTYMHLYPENAIVMDWDQPLEAFDGMTAFQVSINRGFAQHTRQIADFQWYYLGHTKASTLPFWGPCDFGLYRSTVGQDVQKDDFFENVTTHAQLAAIAEAERLAQEEAARLAAEEEARRQAEAEEQSAREEAQRLAQQAAREEEQKRARNKPVADRSSIAVVAASLFVALVAIVTVVVVRILREKK